MASVKTARGIVADAEKALRDLMQKEIQEHHYRDLPELAHMADALGRILRPDGGTTKRRSTTPPAKRRRRSSAPARGPASADYPHFERDGDKLIKVGWSKKAREEYEHRSPRGAVAAFAAYLASRVNPGAAFVMDDLLPVPDDSGGEIPSYQVYMTLAWLRRAGVVEKRGRDGYVLNDMPINGSGFNELWESVPSR